MVDDGGASPGVSTSRSGPRMNLNVRLTLTFAILLSMCSSLLSQTPLAYFILLLRHENHLSVGGVTGLQGLMSMLTAIPASLAADRFGRQVLLRIGSAVGFCAVCYTSVCLLVLRGRISDDALYWCMCGASAFFGFWMGLYAAPLEALFGDSIESGRRSRLYVLRSALRTSGTALGPLVSIVVFCIYGDSWKPNELVSVMILGCVVACLPCAILCLFRDSRALGSLSEGFLSRSPVGVASGVGVGGGGTEGSGVDGLDPLGGGGTPPKPPPHRWALRPHHVAPLIAITDLISMLGSGMTANFIPLWFGQKLELHPIAVNALLIASPTGIALAALAAQRLSLHCGRITVSAGCRAAGVLMLVALSLVDESEPLTIVPLYLLYRWSMNCTTALTKSVLNDYVRNARRSRWNALESLNFLSWSGSAALGGKLIDQPGIGYRHTFQVTAAVQLVSLLLLLPLLSVVSAEKDAKGARRILRATTSARLLSDDSLSAASGGRSEEGAEGGERYEASQNGLITEPNGPLLAVPLQGAVGVDTEGGAVDVDTEGAHSAMSEGSTE